MANLDTLAQNLEVLRGRVQELIDQTDEQGAAQEQATTEIQQTLQQKGNQAEAASLRPPPFKGMTTEDADRWIKNFLSYAEFCNMDNQRKARIFPLMVDGAAEVWYNGLGNEVKTNWHQLEQAYRQKYIAANNLNWLKEQGLFARIQAPGELVETYITDVRQKCDQLQKGEAETRSIILRGLQPTIKAFVIGQQPATLEDLETKAKLAESIEKITPKNPSTDKVNLMQDTYNKTIGDLTRSIQGLEEQIKQQNRDVQFMKNNMRSQRYSQGRGIAQYPETTKGNFQPFCQRCKKMGHRASNCVRRPEASDMICFRCNRRGHLKRDCNQARGNQIQSSNFHQHPLNFRKASQDGGVTRFGRM